MPNKLEKFGSFGSVVAAAACPVCFPKLALLGALFGFGSLVEYEVFFLYGAQILIVMAVIGHAISYKNRQNWSLLILAIFSATLFFISLYIYVLEILSYLALIGMVAATLWVIIESRRCAVCATPID